MTFPGSGLAALASSKRNLEDISKFMQVQTIGHDKLNQLRHVRFFGNMANMHAHMSRHAAILRPKFEAVENALEKDLGGLGIASWTNPRGGYFISFDSMDGCAKAIVAKCAEAGVKLTPAGATYPYGKDPKDSNIRIAPSFPTLEELKKAAEILQGIPFPVGDASFCFPVFEDFQILLQFWDGDDEFPANILFLFDKNALQYMHYETLWYVMNSLTDRLKYYIQ